MGYELPEELQRGPIEQLALERDILIHVAKHMGVTLSYTQANEALLVATKPRPAHRPKSSDKEVTEAMKRKEKLQGDTKALKQWFAMNI